MSVGSPVETYESGGVCGVEVEVEEVVLLWKI
jgi:hypothetical protein